MFKNAPVTVTVTVWDLDQQIGKTGDKANLSLVVIADGQSAGSISATQIEEAGNGEYSVTVTAEQNSGDQMTVTGVSATTNVRVIPAKWQNAPDWIKAMAGYGDVVVDHDYGGADNLAYKTSDGVGISGASIRAYLAADYDAGHRGEAFVQGRSVTDDAGRWRQAMMLTPDSDYVLLYWKRQVAGADIKRISVVAE